MNLTNDEINIVEEFKEDFFKVKEQGWIKSLRTHNTGIGKTFEESVGVIENNSQDVDYKGYLEIKSKRALSESMLTLFTKSPSYPKKANTYLRENFGTEEDNDPTLKILHTTISHTCYNTYKGKLGFKLEINYENKKIYIKIKDLETKDIINYEVYYSFDDLEKIIEKKCKNIAFISAEHKKVNGEEYFKFTSAKLLTGMNFDKFLEAVEEGIIVYDIRIGVYKTGKNKGKTHDHGSGFRIKKNKIEEFFNVEEL